MVRVRLALLVTVALAVGPACGGDDGALLVDLRTELVPGVDFAEVETRIGTRAPVLTTATAGQSFAAGRRVAEASDLANGTYEVVVLLYTPTGSVLASRRTNITVDGTTALLVTITRGCLGLEGCTWSGADAGVPEDGSVPLDSGRADAGASDSGIERDAGAADASAVDAGALCSTTWAAPTASAQPPPTGPTRPSARRSATTSSRSTTAAASPTTRSSANPLEIPPFSRDLTPLRPQL